MKEITGGWLINNWENIFQKYKETGIPIKGWWESFAHQINQFFHEPELSDEERSQEIMKESVNDSHITDLTTSTVENPLKDCPLQDKKEGK
jgi:hypothetical protein